MLTQADRTERVREAIGQRRAAAQALRETAAAIRRRVHR
jgi:hypothetical protein